MEVMAAVTAVATMVADFTAEAAASMAAVRPFTAADFVQVMSSTAAFVDIGSRTGTTFTGISIMRRPITITRTAAGWSGPITDRAGSAAIAGGITITGATTTGIIAIGEIETMAEINQAPRAYSAKLDTGFANRIRATYKSRAFSCGKPDATLPENALWGA
jgi:hypothetical protein